MKRKVQELTILVAAVGASFFVLFGGASSAGQKADSFQGARREAAVIFKSSCATCHGKDGRAKTFKAKFNGARNLTDAAWQQSVTDERIFNSIMNGRGKMPAFGKKLSEAEIEALVAYVRGLKK